MKPSDLQGMYPAIPTPLTDDGKLDIAKLEALIEFNLSGGAKGLAPIGGTGEFTALAYETRLAVVRETVRIVNGRVPVVAGVVSPGWAEAVEHGKAFKDAGADALLLVTPFYVIPSQQGVIDYFHAYRQTVDLPIVYYDVPSRTSFVTAVETLKTLGEDGTIIGAKICNTDAYYFNRLSVAVGDKIALLSGDDMMYAVHIMYGATGGILASAPMLPAFWTRIHDTLIGGNHAEGIALHRKLLPTFAALFNEVNPGPLKSMMADLGMPIGPVSLPLKAPNDATRDLISKAIKSLKAQGIA
ncbi:dihydrodipicolinate synthase family protein [Brucella gallinifaecis]|uniref:dihydrodipicolinate synthase family protein n=1 Tax=Brucella gallinifaecis TaxID=215590 RepID=UPI002360C5E7|nr:dihydrodipicolinate synthase family protein [Brucella gallinifaecis]